MSAPSPMYTARTWHRIFVLSLAALVASLAHATPGSTATTGREAVREHTAHEAAHSAHRRVVRRRSRRRVREESAEHVAVRRSHPSSHRETVSRRAAIRHRRPRRRDAELRRRAEAAGEIAAPRPASLRIARGGMPLPLRGSLEILVRQDQRLQADGLQRIEDEQDLASRIAHHLLVPIPVSAGLSVNDQLAPNHRYCRPWTARFLADLASEYDAAFHSALDVTSAVRPVTYQERLTRINGNAAPAEGDIVSPHVMGATIDIGKKGLSWREMAWMRRHLLALEDAGKIDVEEEFHQSCFHITVYRSYLPEGSTPEPGDIRTDTAEKNGAPSTSAPALRDVDADAAQSVADAGGQ